LKQDVNGCRRIDGLSIFLCRFEFDLLGGAQRVLIETMA
jgi:hypothetical protein